MAQLLDVRVLVRSLSHLVSDAIYNRRHSMPNSRHDLHYHLQVLLRITQVSTSLLLACGLERLICVDTWPNQTTKPQISIPFILFLVYWEWEARYGASLLPIVLLAELGVGLVD